ncbi:MAG: hypothetical protein Q9227_007333 [Pyrenula ochraceoflavens]
MQQSESVAKDIARVRDGAKVVGLGGVDVRKPESLEHAAKTCADELGAIDFVIAGAAGNFLAPMSQLSANAFKAVIDIDVLGSYNTMKATIPYLVKSAQKHRSDGRTPHPSGTGGRIIFVSATFHYTGVPLQSHVSAAKASVDSLSASVALEYGPYGLTSNVVTPGPISGTEGMDRLVQASQDSGKEPGEKLPLGRYGRVKEIADATVWLFSDAANYVNGSVVVIDGAAWRVPWGNPSIAFPYPDFLLEGSTVEGVKGMKEEKRGSKL